MNKFNASVAVVTGAGSGIGQALSYALASHGARLAISDINAENLQVTRAELESRGAEVVATTLDVADEAAFFDYAKSCEDHFGQVNLVINNAGVALGSGPLWENSMEDFKWLMNINFYGVLSGTKAFLPILQKAEWGHIVNISSLFGIVSVPEQSAYNASKFAVRGLTEALRHELKLENSTVSCTSVHPGGIKTNIAKSARFVNRDGVDAQERSKQAAADFAKLARTTSEDAAQQILRAVNKDKARLLIGLDAKILDKVQRLFPTKYFAIVALLIRLLGGELPKT